jgi:NAD(P)-dependent dehydrogenase (short-subunit alcohol dehydrogenase family)
MGMFENKVVLVTGAARGLGRNHAVRFAEQGADVIAIDRCESSDSVDYALSSGSDLEETARLVQAAGRRVLTRQLDIRDSAAVNAAFREGVDLFGRLDIVVANASVVSLSPAEMMSDELWDDVISVNLGGTFKTARAAIPYLRETAGSIVIIGSAASRVSLKKNAHDVASKNGVIGLMKVLARERVEDKIRVNAVLPTGVNTTMIHNPHTYEQFHPGRSFEEISEGDMRVALSI